MQNRSPTDTEKNEKKISSTFTIFDHRDNLEILIAFMEKTDIKPTCDLDHKSAENQLAFAKQILTHLDKMLTTPNTHFNLKKNIGIELSKIPSTYFGPAEMPTIDGHKSKTFALLLAGHYKDLSRIQFSTFEIEASIIISKISFLGVRSLPEQMIHHLTLAEKIENKIEEYENSGIKLKK